MVFLWLIKIILGVLILIILIIEVVWILIKIMMLWWILINYNISCRIIVLVKILLFKEIVVWLVIKN